MPLTPEQLRGHQHNAEALRICFNVLNAIVKEIQAKKWSGESHCDVFTLAAAAKIIYQRWETEKRALGPENLPSTEFCPPTPIALPEVPEGGSAEVAQAITSSIFYQLCWGHLRKQK